MVDDVDSRIDAVWNLEKVTVEDRIWAAMAERFAAPTPSMDACIRDTYLPTFALSLASSNTVAIVFFSFITLRSPGKRIQSYFFETNQLSVFRILIFTLLFLISVGYLAGSGFNPFIYFRF